jgi:hypothetical protein
VGFVTVGRRSATPNTSAMAVTMTRAMPTNQGQSFGGFAAGSLAAGGGATAGGGGATDIAETMRVYSLGPEAPSGATGAGGGGGAADGSWSFRA